MIAPFRPIASAALAATVALSGCMPPAPQGQKSVISIASAPRLSAVATKSGGAEACGDGVAAASRAFAAAAQVVVSVPIACADLGPGGNLVAGCETGAVGAMSRQAMTCAAIKTSAQGRYASCVGLTAPASGSGPQSCEAQPAPAPNNTNDSIEVGSLTGYGYIYKSPELVTVRTSTASGVKEISGRKNPDGTTTVETRGFTATRDRNGGIVDVQFNN
jgi:hypothetical protein